MTQANTAAIPISGITVLVLSFRSSNFIAVAQSSVRLEPSGKHRGRAHQIHGRPPRPPIKLENQGWWRH